MDRAKTVGCILANILIHCHLGVHPVLLIGFWVLAQPRRVSIVLTRCDFTRNRIYGVRIYGNSFYFKAGIFKYEVSA